MAEDPSRVDLVSVIGPTTSICSPAKANGRLAVVEGIKATHVDLLLVVGMCFCDPGATSPSGQWSSGVHLGLSESPQNERGQPPEAVSCC